jgi:CMP-N-acetylneuraminic acid synthetase
MTATFAVTFEFNHGKPETWQGTIDARSLPMLTRKAIKSAMAAFPKRKWDSIVCVLERTNSEDKNANSPV